MNTKLRITRTAVLFAALAIAGISLIVGSQSAPEAFDQTVLVALGSAIFGAALTFFLIRVLALTEK